MLSRQAFIDSLTGRISFKRRGVSEDEYSISYLETLDEVARPNSW
jgi:hypothetical protein